MRLLDSNEGWRSLPSETDGRANMIYYEVKLHLPFPSDPFPSTSSHSEPEFDLLMLPVCLTHCGCQSCYCLCRCCCCSISRYPCDFYHFSRGTRVSKANNPSRWKSPVTFQRLIFSNKARSPMSRAFLHIFEILMSVHGGQISLCQA